MAKVVSSIAWAHHLFGATDKGELSGVVFHIIHDALTQAPLTNSIQSNNNALVSTVGSIV